MFMSEADPKRLQQFSEINNLYKTFQTFGMTLIETLDNG